MKPFFDAYTGPYRANHRYWTGLLLLVRIALTVTFFQNQSNNPTKNLYAVLLVSVCLLTYFAAIGGSYQRKMHNYLELTSLCNLCLTLGTVLYELSNSKHSSLPIIVSTSIAFVTFSGIVFCHAQKLLFLTSVGAKMKTKVAQFYSRFPNNSVLKIKADRTDHCVQQTSTKVTSTVVELKEPLLEDDEGL